MKLISGVISPVRFWLLLLIVATFGAANCLAGSNAPQSDASAIIWATRAMAALTGGVPVNSVSLQANVTQLVGSSQQTGTMTLGSSGRWNSQISITIGSSTVSESRSLVSRGPAGQWIDASGTTHPMAFQNLWTDAAWFFPAFSMLADYNNPNLVFKDLGQETRRGRTVEHLRVYRTALGTLVNDPRELALMSVTDYYLDSQTALPVAASFFAHADNDLGINIPVEITFSGYQKVGQATVPFQIVKYFNGTQLLQISVTGAQVQ